MDFNRFERILNHYGLNDDPAISDPNFLVRIAPLPPEYEKQALGLYYPEAPENPFKSRLWVPPDADDETVKHELGHRIGHYYFDDISEPTAEVYRKKKFAGVVMKAAMRGPSLSGAGTWAEIIGLDASAYESAYSNIMTGIIIRNNYTSDISIRGEIKIEYDGQFYPIAYTTDPSDQVVSPDSTYLLQGNFNMPDKAVKVHGYSYYYDSDGNWVEDGHLVTTVKLWSGSIPSDYAYSSRVVYSAAADYIGDAEICTVAFKAMTAIPGVSWIIESFIGRFMEGCLDNNAVPLEMRIFTKPGIFGMTDYLVQFYAYPTVSGRSAVMNPLLLIIPWGLVLKFAISLAVGIFSIIGIQKLTDYNESKKLKTTTTTAPVDKNLGPGQSLTANTPAYITDLGGGGTVVSSPDGSTIYLQAGQTATVPAGGTAVGGLKGARVSLPGGSTVTEAEPEKEQGVIESTVKWVSIGAIVVVAGLFGIAALQSLGKREVYKVK